MRTELFDFELPRDRIALRPANPRDAARLLVIRPALPFEDRHVRDLPELLRPGDRLVLNDTRVIPARLLVGEWADIRKDVLARGRWTVSLTYPDGQPVLCGEAQPCRFPLTVGEAAG